MDDPGFAPLTAGQVRTRREWLTDYLDVWGDLRVEDLGGGRDRRLLQFSLRAPGEDLPVEIFVLYREYYRRARSHRGPAPDLWHLGKYTYEYVDVTRNARLAYHLHARGTHRLVPHAHCGEAEHVDPRTDQGHLRAIALDLREAHTEFMKLWASDNAPDCAGFRPLQIPQLL